MSFILDALRKSEHDRQRQSGPGLAEVAVAPRKPKTNVWATAAIALLIVNLIGVGVLLLRRANHEAPTPARSGSPSQAGSTAVSPAPAPAPASTVAQPPAPAAQSAPATAPAAAPAPAAVPPTVATTQSLPQPTLQRRPPPAAPPGRNPLEAEVSGEPPDIDAGMAARAASVPAGPPAVTRAPVAGTAGGSVQYAPIPQSTVASAIAAETRSAAAAGAAHPSPAAQSAQPALPTADEMTASAGLPPLHLDLHVYSNRAQERFIFVNSHKYREGDTMQEGPTVEQITQAGAVLNYRGSRFLLTRN
jgi:general secretion pathway protein B